MLLAIFVGILALSTSAVAWRKCPNDYSCCVLPDEEDCTKVYRITLRGEYHMDCPNDTIFDHYLYFCNQAKGTTCHRKGMPPFWCPADGKFVNSLNRSTFINCKNYVPYLESCPEGTVFSDSLEACCIPEDTEIICEKDGIYPHPKDCSKFVQCSGNIPFESNCPADLIFDPDLKRCDYRKDGICKPVCM